MWARTRFDIGWSDVLSALGYVLFERDANERKGRIERYWAPQGDGVACLSVRSAFDLLLRALELPAGSEVLFSALNIKGMVTVARRHGLLPVPVDLDPETLLPRVEQLERVVTPRSRMFVVAPLFGARPELGELAAFCRRHRLMLVEDCAQGFLGPRDRGGPSDVSLFSFGPLKTSTALGGALARVDDPDLCARMRTLQEGDSQQRPRAFLVRLLRFAGLKLATYRIPYAMLSRLLGRGGDAEARLGQAVRSIARQKTSKSLRLRPCAAQLALLERRLRHFREDRMALRISLARGQERSLRGRVACPGTRHVRHGFWAFPVLVKQPALAILALRAAGFDAAPVTSLREVPAPDERPELRPVAAEQILRQLVFLPCDPVLGAAELSRQAAILTLALGESGA